MCLEIKIIIKVIGDEIHVLLEKNGTWADEMEFNIDDIVEMERAILSFIDRSIPSKQLMKTRGLYS
jgi:hypothetical protein